MHRLVTVELAQCLGYLLLCNKSPQNLRTINIYHLVGYEGQESRSDLARWLLLRVSHEEAAKVSPGPAVSEDLTEVYMALGRSASPSASGSLHGTTHSIAFAGFGGAVGGEKETVTKTEAADFRNLIS